MKLIIALALLLSLGAAVLLGVTFTNLLSGHFETRTCLTDCVKNTYFIAAGLGLSGVLLAAWAWLRSGFRGMPFLALFITLLPFSIIAGIFTVGTLGSMS